MNHSLRFACGIEVGNNFAAAGEQSANSFVVTGGGVTGKVVKTVTKYTEVGNDDGWMTDSYPDLNIARRNHACSMFRDYNGDAVSILNYLKECNIINQYQSMMQTLLVTGGADASENFLSSTEIYSDSTATWSFASALPSPRQTIMSATLDNSVFVFGEY